MPHITISHRGMLYKMVPIEDFQTLHEVIFADQKQIAEVAIQPTRPLLLDLLFMVDHGQVQW
jgi:hypothetical protein